MERAVLPAVHVEDRVRLLPRRHAESVVVGTDEAKLLTQAAEHLQTASVLTANGRRAVEVARDDEGQFGGDDATGGTNAVQHVFFITRELCPDVQQREARGAFHDCNQRASVNLVAGLWKRQADAESDDSYSEVLGRVPPAPARNRMRWSGALVQQDDGGVQRREDFNGAGGGAAAAVPGGEAHLRGSQRLQQFNRFAVDLPRLRFVDRCVLRLTAQLCESK